MAKIPFSKLQASINGSDTKAFYCNKNGEEIYYEVKRYLPFSEKLDLVTSVINQSVDDNGYYNPMRVKLYLTLETVYAYTNLSFTSKMLEDPFKLYDIIVSTGIFKDIISCIDENEWAELQDSIWSTIKNIYDYKNSAMGIMEMVTGDYSNLNMDAQNIQTALKDPENLTLLKDIMTKLG